MDKMKPEKKKMKRSAKIILIVVGVLLGLILAAVITVVIWGKVLLSKIPRLEPDEQLMTQEQIDELYNEKDEVDPNHPAYDSDDVDMPDGPADRVENSEDIINIMLVGQDRRPGQFRQRSDAMILCTVNKKTKTLTMTSFLRDIWVRIPGYYDERLNVPYAIGGFKLLNKTMEYQFGIHADYNVEVDFTGFESVINALGGVPISLTSAEAATMNRTTGWGLSKGVNKLNGEQALAYARIRYIDSDFNRTNRQRTVLNAVFEQLKNKSATELYNLALKILPMVTTDMKDSEIVELIYDMATILPEMTVASQRIPIDDSYSFASIDGKSVLLLSPENLEKNKNFIKRTIGE